MPIFEHDDEMTPEEFKRQQRALNVKVNRLGVEEFIKKEESSRTTGEPFNGGDTWENSDAPESD